MIVTAVKGARSGVTIVKVVKSMGYRFAFAAVV